MKSEVLLEKKYFKTIFISFLYECSVTDVMFKWSKRM